MKNFTQIVAAFSLMLAGEIDFRNPDKSVDWTLFFAYTVFFTIGWCALLELSKNYKSKQ